MYVLVFMCQGICWIMDYFNNILTILTSFNVFGHNLKLNTLIY